MYTISIGPLSRRGRRLAWAKLHELQLDCSYQYVPACLYRARFIERVIVGYFQCFSNTFFSTFYCRIPQWAAFQKRLQDCSTIQIMYLFFALSSGLSWPLGTDQCLYWVTTTTAPICSKFWSLNYTAAAQIWREAHIECSSTTGESQ